MGNYKFRLSDMMPNAWFYKLRDMSLTTNTTRNPNSTKKPTKSTKRSKTYSQKSHNSSSHPNQPRQSYYYSSDFSTVSKTTSVDDLPRRSASKQSRRARRKTVYKPSPRRTPPSSVDHHHCSCQQQHHHHHHHQHDLDFVKSPVSSEFESDVFDYANDGSQNGQASRSSSCSCGFSSSATDIIIDVESRSYGFDAMLELDLPPILTKPTQQTKTVSLSSSNQKDRETVSVSVSASIPKETANRKSISSGIKLRAKSNSPRIQPNSSRRKSISRRSKTETQKKGFAESFAIVKASVDPEKDFRESMMEMIVENNIRASKDLEELLACYLSLNSDEYHGLIIKAFEQIWFNLPDLKS